MNHGDSSMTAAFAWHQVGIEIFTVTFQLQGTFYVLSFWKTKAKLRDTETSPTLNDVLK